MLTGNLNKISLSEVLRLLAMSRQTGALVIEKSDFGGMIFLQLGQIIHAVTSELEGVDALNELAQQEDANFTFNDGFTAPSHTLADLPTDGLIAKLKKQGGELRALRQSIPQPDDIPLYLIEKKFENVRVTSGDLAVLLKAEGALTHREIAAELGLDLTSVLLTIGKFNREGVVQIQPGKASPSPKGPVPPAPSPNPATDLLETPDSAPAATAEPPRYWRGKRIN